MKKRSNLILTGALLMAATTAHGATYSPWFPGLTNGQPLVPAIGPSYDGWTQSEANPSDLSPLAYGQAVNYDGVHPGVALGGNYATPEADSAYIGHTISLPMGGNGIRLGFTVGRFDISPAPNPQNGFEIGAYTTGGTNLFSFVLGPTIDPDKWSMAYRSGAGSNVPIFTTLAFALDQVSTLVMDFTPNGSTTDFAFSLTTLGTTLSTAGTLAIDPNTVMDDLRVTMLKVPGANPVTDPFDAYGTNYIAIVPEPSGLMLLGLTAGMAMIRRRRAA